MTGVLSAELGKAWASRGTRGAYAVLFLLMIGFSAFVAGGSTTEPPGAFGDNDIVADALGGVLTGMIVAAVIGVVTIGGEYGSGMIGTTFAAMPRRGRVVLAKAWWAWLGTTLVAIAATYPAFLVARPLQRSNGFIEPGYPDPSLTSGPVLRAMIGTGLLVGVIGLFGVGVAAIVKRSAIAIPLVIGCFVVPAMLSVDESVARQLQRWTPMAGFSIQHTVDRHDYYVAPWRGLGVTTAYAVLALAIGTVVTQRRDV